MIETEVVKDALIEFVTEVEAEPETECDTLATLALCPGDCDGVMLSYGVRDATAVSVRDADVEWELVCETETEPTTEKVLGDVGETKADRD